MSGGAKDGRVDDRSHVARDGETATQGLSGIPRRERRAPIRPTDGGVQGRRQDLRDLQARGAALQVSLKCDPALAEQLQEAHDAIAPGYHLNKRHLEHRDARRIAARPYGARHARGLIRSHRQLAAPGSAGGAPVGRPVAEAPRVHSEPPGSYNIRMQPLALRLKGFLLPPRRGRR